MITSSTTTPVSVLLAPLEIGTKVKFAVLWRPLAMAEGEVVEVLAPKDMPQCQWCYRISYTFKGHACTDLVDHTDPTLYKIS